MTGHWIRLERRNRHARLRLIVVYLLVFVLAGLAACGTELLRARRATRYSATATLLVPTAWYQGRPGAQAQIPAVDSAAIEREIFSTEPETVRQHLKVSISESVPERVGIAVTCSDQDPGFAIQLANRLATGYASRRRAEVAREAAERLSGLIAGQDSARRTLQEIRAEIEAIIDRSTFQAAASAAMVPKASADGSAPDSSPFREEERRISSAAPRESPELAEARAKLEELKDRRRQLLLNRTPIHPEVQNIDLRIAESEKHVASIQARVDTASAAALEPKTPPAQSKAPPNKEPPDSSTPAGVFSFVSVMKAVEALQSLRARLDEAASRAGQPAQVEARPALRLLDAENIAIEPADRAEAIPAQLRLWDWLAVAWAAGLVGTAGVGILWRGARVDPPFTSVGQIERSLDIPVLGTIPGVPISSGDAGSRLLPSVGRWPCIAAGLAVMAAYLAFLLLPLVAG